MITYIKHKSYSNTYLSSLVITLVLVFTIAIGILIDSIPAFAVNGGASMNNTYGFDSCSTITPSQMQTIYDETNYKWYNVYLGGSNNDQCFHPSGSWLNSVNHEKWNFIYTWVGPQPPCTTNYGYKSYFSSNTSTAWQQGYNQAIAAYNQLLVDGISNTSNVPVFYDIENDGSGECQAATSAFIEGWDTYLGYYPNQLAGVYGAVCASNLSALATINPIPNVIWGAWDNQDPSTSDLFTGSCGVESTQWTNHQRIKQYSQNIYQFFSGFQVQIDKDCADAWTSPGGNWDTNVC